MSHHHACIHRSAWKEWSALKADYPRLGDVLKIIRLNAHKGTGYAKNVGFDKVMYECYFISICLFILLID